MRLLRTELSISVSVVLLLLCYSPLLASTAYIQVTDCFPPNNAQNVTRPGYVSLDAVIRSENDTTVLDLDAWVYYETLDECQNSANNGKHVIIEVDSLGSQLGHQLNTSSGGLGMTCTFYESWDPPVAGRVNGTYDLGFVPRMRSLVVWFRAEDYANNTLMCMRGVATPEIGPYATSILKWGSVTILVFTSLCSIFIRMRQRRDNGNHRDAHVVPDDPADAFFPGVIECLQYLQFVFLTGCLSLNLPGFFRPVVGQFAWSTLMTFHPVTTDYIYPGIQDRIYAINATYGFEEMAQVLSAPTMSDLWVSVVINLAIAMAAVGTVMAVTYLIREIMRRTKPADLRQEKNETLAFKLKNIGWNLLRVVFNWFLQPILAFCTFELLVIRYLSHTRIAFLAVFLALLALSLVFILYRIVFRKRGYVFMNDSTEDRLSLSFSISARLALVHYFVLIVRGVAFGALQISGRGQIICLAGVETIALIAFIKFQHSSGYTIHTYASGIRLCIILLFIAFLNGVHASGPVKGWVAYVILGLHFCIILATFVIRPIWNVYKEISIPKGARTRVGNNKRPPSEGPAVLGLYELGQRPNRDSYLPGDDILPKADKFTRAGPVPGERFSRPARSASALSGSAPLTATSPTIVDRLSRDTISPMSSWTEDDNRTYTNMSTSDQFSADKDYATREADSYFGNPIPQNDDVPHSPDEIRQALHVAEHRPLVNTLRNLGNRLARGRTTQSNAGFEVVRPQCPPPASEVGRLTRAPDEAPNGTPEFEIRRRPSQTPQGESAT